MSHIDKATAEKEYIELCDYICGSADWRSLSFNDVSSSTQAAKVICEETGLELDGDEHHPSVNFLSRKQSSRVYEFDTADDMCNDDAAHKVDRGAKWESDRTAFWYVASAQFLSSFVYESAHKPRSRVVIDTVC